jgi:hypothetical protein
MRKIKLPENTHAMEELSTALTYASGDPVYTLSTEEEKFISEIYKEYDAVKGMPVEKFKGTELSPTTSKAIRNGYAEVQEKRRLSALRSRILLAVNLCPFCSIMPADELDHHLPQSIYHPLAIYSSNLVPICHRCNNHKKAITGEQAGKSFMHVYFNELPEDEHFFIANPALTEKSLSVEFKVFKSAALNDLNYSQLLFQTERIQLQKRLEKAINDFLIPICVSLEIVYEGNNVESVKYCLSKQYQQHIKSYGLNDWRTVLLKSLFEYDDFCNGGFLVVLQ